MVHELASAVSASKAAQATVVVFSSVGCENNAHLPYRLVKLDRCAGNAGRIAGAVWSWLRDNPQDCVFLNDVSELWSVVPILSTVSPVVLVVHNEARRDRRPLAMFGDHLAAVVVVASYLKQLVTKTTGYPADRVHIISNGSEFPAVSEERTWLPKSKVRLLYAGRIDYLQKGVLDLPRVLHSVRRKTADHVELTVVGPGPIGPLRRSLASRGLTACTRLMDRVNRFELFSLAARHDFLLVPSRFESFGMVTIEAMSMGCVPIAYNIPSGSRDIIRPGQTGVLVRFPSWRAMAAAIVSLARDPDRTARMGRAAARDVRARFTITRTAREYLEVAQIARARWRAARSRTVGPEHPPVDEVSQGRAIGIPGMAGRRLLRPILERSPRLARWLWRRFA